MRRPVLVLALLALPALAAPPPPIAVAVDLTDAPRRLLRSRLVLPVTPGPVTLVYPKWIPGEHGPTGPLTDVAELAFTAGGKRLAWRRDPVDQHALTVEVPSGATELQVALTLLSPPPKLAAFSSGSSASTRLAVLSWNQVVLAPKGAPAASLRYQPSVTLPAGWRQATSLTPAAGQGEGPQVAFEPVSLETLVDSPLLAGQHLELTSLGTLHGAPVAIAVAAEAPHEGKLKPEDVAALKRLVEEEAALYGARHFDRYLFLLTVTDVLPGFGLEHHQSSDNRVSGQSLVDPELTRLNLVPLLAHESTHSWNGKYRRPKGLATADFQAPIRSELLWVYEGLTNYLGHLLTVRSGAWDQATLKEYLALTAEHQRQTGGRRWRPMEDTATAAQLLYGARKDRALLRRSVDFYEEGDLLWLDVDATLRQRSNGQRRLDDVVQAFHGGASSGPQVKPYTLDDVLAALAAAQPLDWRALLLPRVQGPTEDAPLQGLEKAGWRLGYGPLKPELLKAREKDEHLLDLTSSLGLLLDAEGWVVEDVVPGSPADLAGLAPAARLVAVNGRKLTPERLVDAVAETAHGAALELLVEDAEQYRSHALAYQGGLRYPVLERIEGVPDLLPAIFGARAR